MTKSTRTSGLFLPISSLDSHGYIGDFGPAAQNFLSLLAATKQTYWQVLPLNPVGLGNSPYSSHCSAAIDPLYGFFKSESPSTQTSQVNYPKARKEKAAHWQNSFKKNKRVIKSPAFQIFNDQQKLWLDDYCHFQALAKVFGSEDWTRWPKEYRCHDKNSLKKFRSDHEQHYDFIKYTQFRLQQQWSEIRRSATAKGIKIIGDMPIYVSHQSSDVWANQKIFQLNASGIPKYVAGCPPDRFNKKGQHWGNALYDWSIAKSPDFRIWWHERFRRLFELYDTFRVDHFIGFHRYWAIPGQTNDARKGRWRRAHGSELLGYLNSHFPLSELIAEDLGAITPSVWELRDKFAIKGMKVLQFGFDDSPNSLPHKPQNFEKNSVAYTGTHDLMTARSWFELNQNTKIRAIFPGCHRKNFHRHFINCLSLSPANTVIFPLPDVLGLGKSGQINRPGTLKANWQWRMPQSPPKQDLQHLLEITKYSGRA